MKLSIVIPVYNVEHFIERCLNSILVPECFLYDVELIIVNDGSEDNSFKIVTDYAEKYDNIIVISQNNSGLSCARNMGLNHVSGDYVWFVDSDDSICGNVYDKLFILFKNDYDVIALTAEIDKNESHDRLFVNRNMLLEGDYSVWNLFNKGYVYPYSGAQFYVFKTIFLKQNNLLFREGIFYEDLLFTPLFFCKAQSVYYLKDVAYIYYMREGSIINSPITPKKWRDILTVADILWSNLQQYPKNCIQRRILSKSVIGICASFYTNFYMKISDKTDKYNAVALFWKRTYWLNALVISRKYKYLIRLYQLWIFKFLYLINGCNLLKKLFKKDYKYRE